MRIDEDGFWMAEVRRARRGKVVFATGVALTVAGVVGAVVLLRSRAEAPVAASAHAEAPRHASIASSVDTPRRTPSEEPPGDAVAPASDPFEGKEGLLRVFGAKAGADADGDLSDVFAEDTRGAGRVELRTEGRAAAREDATPPRFTGALGPVTGDMVGEATGVGGLGVRGSGGGGGGLAMGTGSLGTVGYGRGAGGYAKGGSAGRGASGKVTGTSAEATRSRGSALSRATEAKAGYAALKLPKAKARREASIEAEEAARPDFQALKAASTDDNVTFDAFLEFLGEWSDRGSTAGYAHVDVRDRRFVRVLDAEGRPVPAATVTVRAGDERLWRGRTYGDGRTALYARASFSKRAEGELTVEATLGGLSSQATLTDGETELRLPEAAPRSAAVPIDVAFLIDTTGSMGDEIARIKGTLLKVTKRVRARHAQVDLRYGAVLYRDRGDSYVTRKRAFTSDIREFNAMLGRISANGGGDSPESLNAGLRVAVQGLKWREGAAKVVFLVADAPPHMDYGEKLTYAETMQQALAQGIRVHAVAASGLDALGTLVFRQIAQHTRGKFIFIQYGSAAASAERHGVTSQIETNDLDTIIFERISAEVAGWGR